MSDQWQARVLGEVLQASVLARGPHDALVTDRMRHSWDDLLKHRVCLLVGPAHCGKTSELKLLRRRLRGESRVCFMLDLGTLVRTTVEETLLAFGVHLITQP